MKTVFLVTRIPFLIELIRPKKKKQKKIIIPYRFSVYEYFEMELWSIFLSLLLLLFFNFSRNFSFSKNLIEIRRTEI